MSTRLVSTATSWQPEESSLSAMRAQAEEVIIMGSTPTLPEDRLLHSQSAWLGVSGRPSWGGGQLEVCGVCRVRLG